MYVSFPMGFIVYGHHCDFIYVILFHIFICKDHISIWLCLYMTVYSLPPCPFSVASVHLLTIPVCLKSVIYLHAAICPLPLQVYTGLWSHCPQSQVDHTYTHLRSGHLAHSYCVLEEPQHSLVIPTVTEGKEGCDQLTAKRIQVN